MWRDFSKKSFESFQRYTKKRQKSKFWMKLRLDRWWENGSVFKIARTKTFLASKYDIKQHSDVFLKIIRVIFNVFIKQSITVIENLKFEIYFVLVEFKHTEFFTSYGYCLLNTKV